MQCLRLGAERFGWNRRSAVPGKVRDGEWLVGMGVASAYRENAVKKSAARVKLDSRGTVTVETEELLFTHLSETIERAFRHEAEARKLSFKTGLDPSLDKLSLGSLVIERAIERATQSGAPVFDFLRGAEDYKYAWGAADAFTYAARSSRGGAYDSGRATPC